MALEGDSNVVETVVQLLSQHDGLSHKQESKVKIKRTPDCQTEYQTALNLRRAGNRFTFSPVTHSRRQICELVVVLRGVLTVANFNPDVPCFEQPFRYIDSISVALAPSFQFVR